MSILRVENNYSWLLSTDDEVKDKIWRAMRHRERGYFHNPRYRMKLWDGYTEFFKRDSGRFLTGNLPEIRAALKILGARYETDDRREDVKFQFDKVDEDFLGRWQGGGKPIKLRDYQVDYINQAIKYKRGIVDGKTGAGKAQPLDSVVWTMKGKTRMGDVIVGDIILTPTGTASVLGVYPQGVKETFELIFRDGEKVRACGEHLWKGMWEDRPGVEEVVTTSQIKNRLDNESVGLLIQPASIGVGLGRPDIWRVVGVEPAGREECQCIKIDSEESLYLTDHFVPTHNTNVMIGILKALPENTPTLVLANKKSLVDQNYKEIMKWGFEGKVGRFYSDYKQPNVITCATVQSAHLLKPILPKIKVMLVDEIHEMMSKKPKAIYAQLKNCSVRIGMSATAFKFGGSDKCQKYEVKGWIGPVFKTRSGDTLSTKELQDRKILSTASCYFFTVTEPKLPYEIYIDAVTRGIAENDHFHEMVARLALGLPGRTLIIVDRIEHGNRLAERIPNAAWVRGEDTLDARNVVIERLKTEEHVVAIATQGIFNTGINVFCHNLINAAGGQADHQIIQRFGRGLRPTDDKSHLCYFDFKFEINDYLEKHSDKRVRILENEGHTVQVLSGDMISTPQPPWLTGGS